MVNKIVVKIPALTISFWVMKICATTLGETAGDMVSMTLKVGYAVSSLILIAFFFATLAAQLSARKFHPLLYWMVILSTSTAGTTMSDYMDRSLQLGYAKGSALLVAILIAIFSFWKWTGRSLSVTEIDSRKSEILYWTAILFSNTLGTALGDFLADSSGLGFLGSNVLISGLLALVCLAYAFTKTSRVWLFWIAFVLTRPFGATMGDVLTKSHDHGGLDLGTMGSSGVLFAILILFILFSMRRRPSAPEL